MAGIGTRPPGVTRMKTVSILSSLNLESREKASQPFIMFITGILIVFIRPWNDGENMVPELHLFRAKK